MKSHLHLLQPLQIGPLTVPNRLMMTTHNPKMTDVRYRHYIEERAAGGVGLIGIPILHEAVSSLSFNSTGRINPVFSADWDAPPDPNTAEGQTFFNELLTPRLRTYADIVHRYGSICFGQIAERGAGRLPETFQPRIAPSSITDSQVRARPHELSTEEVEELIHIFGLSSARIKARGLDGVEIHGAHGYIVEQFLSPLTNRRTDKFGGSYDNRLRFLEEIIIEIRRTCGDTYPIGLRMTGYQDQPGGWSVVDSQELARRVGPSLAYINVTAGMNQALSKGLTPIRRTVDPFTRV